MGAARLNTSEAGACFSLILLLLPGAGAENSPSAETDLLPLLLLMVPVRKGLFATIEFGMGGVRTFLADENGSLWLVVGGNSDGGCCCGAGMAAKGFAWPPPPEGSKSNGDAPEMTCALPWKSTPEDFFLVSGGTGALVGPAVVTVDTLPTTT